MAAERRHTEVQLGPNLPFVVDFHEWEDHGSGLNLLAVSPPSDSEKLREWRESVNNNNCYDMAPKGYTFRDYVLDCQCVSWPLFARAFEGTSEAAKTTTVSWPAQQQNGQMAVHCFHGAVEPQALVEPIPLQHQHSIISASTVGILRRRAPGTHTEELDDAAQWLLQCMKRFAQRAGGADTDPTTSMFIRTDSCSPKDGIAPGAGPYSCTAEDARLCIDACVTSRRVVQGLRTGDGSTLPAKAAQQPMRGPGTPWMDGPWQELQSIPLHEAHPPSRTLDTTGSSIIIQGWSPFVRPECEFRCFVRDNAVRAVTQYLWFSHLPWLQALSRPQKLALCRAIQLFQTQWLRPRLESVGYTLPTYTMDVVVLPLSAAEGDQDAVCFELHDTAESVHAASHTTAFGVRLLELNPFGAHLSSGGGLFDWREDTACMYGYQEQSIGAETSDTISSSGVFPAMELRWLGDPDAGDFP